MEDDYIEMIEQTPVLKTKRCVVFSFLIECFLRYFIYLISLLSLYLYDYFIAITTLIFSFLIIGIIRAYIRKYAIPIKQTEFTYNDKDIAIWYVAKNICFENEIKLDS